MRLRVHGEAAREGTATVLRALLLADLVSRIAELRGLIAHCVVTLPEPPGQYAAVLGAEAARLNIHPPSAFTGVRDAEAELGGSVDLDIAGRDADGDTEPGVPWMQVGSMRWGDAGSSPSSEADPLATRLAVLSSPYPVPLTLYGEALAKADAVIARWRDQVATWATHPSRPPHRDTVQRCEDALEDNLDTVNALAALHALEVDPDVPQGAKFETFVYLDRVFGLDLARDIGRQRG